ncbi:MAG: hypothetical protein LBR26_05085, partial [Prevotella sp.]|nr:hypothetical protein [Prevotella sp.]
DNVQQFDKDLKDFELPESVRKVSQPPKEERYKDRWTNVKLSKPKPGDFFNRRSCSWYWNSKRKDITLLQGLVEFAKEDYETAEKHWNLLAELDKEFYAQQKATGWENATTLARLTWNLRNQKGSLYATPEEMACFKDSKRRLAIFIADLFYENKKHKEALLIYQRLENDELGTLSKNEKAYATLGIFACLCWISRFDEVTFLFPKSTLFIGTPSEKRAAVAIANRIVQHGTPEAYEKALQIYENCIARFPNSPEALTCHFFVAELCRNICKRMPNLGQDIRDSLRRKAIEHMRECVNNIESVEFRKYAESMEKSLLQNR